MHLMQVGWGDFGGRNHEVAFDLDRATHAGESRADSFLQSRIDAFGYGVGRSDSASSAGAQPLACVRSLTRNVCPQLRVHIVDRQYGVFGGGATVASLGTCCEHIAAIMTCQEPQGVSDLSWNLRPSPDIGRK